MWIATARKLRGGWRDERTVGVVSASDLRSRLNTHAQLQTMYLGVHGGRRRDVGDRVEVMPTAIAKTICPINPIDQNMIHQLP